MSTASGFTFAAFAFGPSDNGHTLTSVALPFTRDAGTLEVTLQRAKGNDNHTSPSTLGTFTDSSSASGTATISLSHTIDTTFHYWVEARFLGGTGSVGAPTPTVV